MAMRSDRWIKEAVRAINNLESPTQLAVVLDMAAQQCRDDSNELIAAWQDDGAGHPWEIAANGMESTASAIRKAYQ